MLIVTFFFWVGHSTASSRLLVTAPWLSCPGSALPATAARSSRKFAHACSDSILARKNETWEKSGSALSIFQA